MSLVEVLYVAVLLKLLYARAQEVSENSFRQCLVTNPSKSFGYCLGVGAITKLQSIENDPEFDVVDGVTFSRDEQMYREAYNFVESDPADFRTIVDSIGHVFSKRTMRWDMSPVYPGLSLRVAPSLAPGGTLEFVLDPRRESVTQHNLKEASTGRLLARQFLVPLLLGLKFNVATIAPIIFGLVALAAKKALVLSKFALIISTAYALGSLIFSNSNQYQPSHNYQPSHHYQPGQHYQPGLTPSFGIQHNKYPEEDYSETFYRGNNVDVNDQLNIRGRIPVQEEYTEQDQIKGRNFAWSEAEKKEIKT